MHLNGWLDTLIQTGGDVASNIFKPSTSTYPTYTPPMFPTAPQYPQTTRTQQGSGWFSEAESEATTRVILIAVAAALGVYLLTRKRGR